MKIIQCKISIDRKFFGRVVRTYREDVGLTQQELAGLLGMSKSFVSNVELGDERALTIRTLEKLVNALDIPIWDIALWKAE